MLWFLTSVALAEQRVLFHCDPVAKTVLSSGVGVFGTQGPWDVWMGTDADVLFSRSFAKPRCLRWGSRAHVSWVSPWREEGVLGIEAVAKTQMVIGYQGMVWEQVAMGGYLLGGAKIHHVRQRVSYPERNIDSNYTSTAVLPALSLYMTVDVFPRENLGVHLNVSLPLMDYEREFYWYNNRLVGVGLSFRI